MEWTEMTLSECQELRFEVESKVVFVVTSGSAEIYGSELVLHKEYEFHKVKLALFTFDGCTLKVKNR